MTITVKAVYEQGVFRPVRPLSLADGEVCDLTVATERETAGEAVIGNDVEQAYVKRLIAAHSLDEALAVMATAPPLPDGYDLMAALNANRRAASQYESGSGELL